MELPAFTIDLAPVRWGAYLPFIEAGGYDNASAWTPAGWAWRQRELPSGLPRYLARDDAGAVRNGRLSCLFQSGHCRWIADKLPINCR